MKVVVTKRSFKCRQASVEARVVKRSDHPHGRFDSPLATSSSIPKAMFIVEAGMSDVLEPRIIYVCGCSRLPNF